MGRSYESIQFRHQSLARFCSKRTFFYLGLQSRISIFIGFASRALVDFYRRGHRHAFLYSIELLWVFH